MHKILPAIAFCLALPAFADTVATAPTNAPLAREGMMHATLVVPVAGPVGPRGGEHGVRKAALDDDAQALRDAEGDERGMLLAALALMAGIVVRRWGGGRS